MGNEAEIQVTPTHHGLLKDMREVDEQIAKGEIELADKVKMKLTEVRRLLMPMR